MALSDSHLVQSSSWPSLLGVSAASCLSLRAISDALEGRAAGKEKEINLKPNKSIPPSQA